MEEYCEMMLRAFKSVRRRVWTARSFVSRRRSFVTIALLLCSAGLWLKIYSRQQNEFVSEAGKNVGETPMYHYDKPTDLDQMGLHKNTSHAESDKHPDVKRPYKDKHVDIVKDKQHQNVINTAGSKPKNGINKNKTMCNLARVGVNDVNISIEFGKCVFPSISTLPDVDQRVNNLGKLNLPLLANYKNPCWYEALPVNNTYQTKVHMFWWQVKASFDRMIPVWEYRRRRNQFWRLRCLPLVYIIGLTSSGSGDLYEVLLRHPRIVKPATKEPFYWDRNKWKWNAGLSNYLDLFDEAAEHIRSVALASVSDSQPKDMAYHPMITMDGSVNYLFEFGGANTLPDNQDKEPKVLLPHLIRNLTPNMDIKVILTLRNPTERLFMTYCSVNAYEQLSAEEFHELASNQVKRINNCLKKRPLRFCLYNKPTIESKKKVEVHAGIYYGYIQDWLKVFPKMKLIRWEDYKSNRKSIVKTLFEYIGLVPLPMSISDTSPDEDPKPNFKMLDETRTLLDDFYGPYNNKLAELVNDERFAFVS